MIEARFRLDLDYDAKLAAILTPEQYRRLLGIGIQVMGPLAVMWPEMRQALRMLPPQSQLIEDFWRREYIPLVFGLKERRYAIDDALRSESDPERRRKLEEERAGLERAIRDARTKAARHLRALLTPAQRRRFNDLIGEPFDLTLLLHPSQRAAFQPPAATAADDAKPPAPATSEPATPPPPAGQPAGSPPR